MKKVSVILNCFRRPHSLKDQYSAVLSQSIKPHEILVWKNDPGVNIPFDFSSINAVVSHNNTNFGVWARFSFALNCTGDYICVLDDDTIPGPNWFANCIECIENEHNGLYGTIGVIFNDLEYRSYERVGWAAPNGETRKVDIVGHSWFFRRDLLSAFWRETVPPLSHLCGEDMHFSYSIQKYLNLCTYVPPHPTGDTSLWGSDPDSAQRLGVDQHAISVNHHSEIFGNSLKHYYNKGFNLQRI
jgi:glycosyltransferase involved in cell wall biosynthesis